MKRLLQVAAGAALLVTLTFTAMQMPALAQQSSGTPEAGSTEAEEPGFLDALADSLGISREDLDSAIDDAQIAMIDQWAENARESIESGESFFPVFGGGFDIGQGGLLEGVVESRPILSAAIEHRAGEPAIFGGGGMVITGNGMITSGFGENLAELASFLGLAEDDLIDQLAGGSTLLEIAGEAGISEDELRTYLIEQATERIDDFLTRSAGESDPSDSSESGD